MVPGRNDKKTLRIVENCPYFVRIIRMIMDNRQTDEALFESPKPISIDAFGDNIFAWHCFNAYTPAQYC
jgi:hypothetical protein